jgi:hypothetical protein
MRRSRVAFNEVMRTVDDIRVEIERASARRAELWEALGAGVDPDKSAQAKELTALIDDLYAEIRALKARERFGDSALIRARARAEERLERDSRRLDRAA